MAEEGGLSNQLRSPIAFWTCIFHIRRWLDIFRRMISLIRVRGSYHHAKVRPSWPATPSDHLFPTASGGSDGGVNTKSRERMDDTHRTCLDQTCRIGVFRMSASQAGSPGWMQPLRHSASHVAGFPRDATLGRPLRQAGTVRKIIEAHNLDSAARAWHQADITPFVSDMIFFRTCQDSSRHPARPRSPRPLSRTTAGTARLRMGVDASSDEPSRSADRQGPLATWRSLERRRP